MYYVYVTSGPSLLTESTDSMIYRLDMLYAVENCNRAATGIIYYITHKFLALRLVNDVVAHKLALKLSS